MSRCSSSLQSESTELCSCPDRNLSTYEYMRDIGDNKINPLHMFDEQFRERYNIPKISKNHYGAL